MKEISEKVKMMRRLQKAYALHGGEKTRQRAEQLEKEINEHYKGYTGTNTKLI